MRSQPKKYNSKVTLFRKDDGDNKRLANQKVILDKSSIFPKPLEYEDIDKAVTDFADNVLSLSINGDKIPTFTLFSNQRFSEYSQTWQHVDDAGNLYLNFKTINREKNPKKGSNQGNSWNIPGGRKYTLLQREVLDDNGTESYEVYTMKQPYCVDLIYNINFVTNLFEKINDFNSLVNKTFSACQFYIRPNGHFIPLMLETIDDETSYSIDERKFYVQKIVVKAMAYIIEEKDFEVQRFPKHVQVGVASDLGKKPLIEIEEKNDNVKNKTLSVIIDYPPYVCSAEFEIDCNMFVQNIELDNVKSYNLFINGKLCLQDKDFELNDGDDIKICIRKSEYNANSIVRLNGYDKEAVYVEGEIAEKVYEQIPPHEDVIVI